MFTKRDAVLFNSFLLTSLLSLCMFHPVCAQTTEDFTDDLGFEINEPLDDQLFHSTIVVNPISFANDDGSFAGGFLGIGFDESDGTFPDETFFGADRNALIEGIVKDIYAQIGIDVVFMPTQQTSNSEANIGENAINSSPSFGQPGFLLERPASDFDVIGEVAEEQNAINETENVLNVASVSLVPGLDVTSADPDDHDVILGVAAPQGEEPVDIVIAESSFWADADDFLEIGDYNQELIDDLGTLTVNEKLAWTYLLEEALMMARLIGESYGITPDGEPFDEDNPPTSGVMDETDILQFFASTGHDELIHANTYIWTGVASGDASDGANWGTGETPGAAGRPFAFNPFADIFDEDEGGDVDASIPGEIRTVDLLFVENPGDALSSEISLGTGLTARDEFGFQQVVGFHNVTIGEGVEGSMRINGELLLRNTTGTVVDTSTDPDLFPGELNDEDVTIDAASTIDHLGSGTVNFTGTIRMDDVRFAGEDLDSTDPSYVSSDLGEFVTQDTMNVLNINVAEEGGRVLISGLLTDNSDISPLATTQLFKQGPGTLEITGTFDLTEDVIFEEGLIGVASNVFTDPTVSIVVETPEPEEDIRHLYAVESEAILNAGIFVGVGATLNVGGGTGQNLTGLIIDGQLDIAAGGSIDKVGRNTVLLTSTTGIAEGTFNVFEGTLDASSAGTFNDLNFNVTGSTRLFLGDGDYDEVIISGSNTLTSETALTGKTELVAGQVLLGETVLPAGTTLPAGSEIAGGSIPLPDGGIFSSTSPLTEDVTFDQEVTLPEGTEVMLSEDLTINGSLVLPESTELNYGTVVSDPTLFQFSTEAQGGGYLLSGGMLYPAGEEAIGIASMSSLVVDAGGALLIDVAGGGLNDVIEVDSLANLDADTQVFILPTPGETDPGSGDSWEIISSDAVGVVTTPTYVTSPRWQLSSSSSATGDLTVTLDTIDPFASFVGQGMDAGFARYLDALEASSATSTIISDLDSQSALAPNSSQELVRLVNLEADGVKVSGGFAMADFSRSSSFGFMQSVNYATRGSLTELVTPFERSASSESEEDALFDDFSDEPAIATVNNQTYPAGEPISAIHNLESDSSLRGLSLFAEVFTVYGEGERRVSTPAYDGFEYGIMLGAEMGPFVFGEDKNISISLGVAGGLSDSEINADSASTEAFTMRTAPYLYGNVGPFKYAFNVALARHDLDLTRNSIGGNHFGDTDAMDISTYAEIANVFLIDSKYLGQGWQVEPHVGLLYTYYRQDGYTETGPAPLSYSDFDQTSLSSRIGVTVRSSARKTFGIYTHVESTLGWQHEYLDNTYGGTYVDVNAVSGSQSMSIPDRDRAYLGLGLNLRLNDHWSSFLRYEGQIGGNAYAHGLFGGLRYRF